MTSRDDSAPLVDPIKKQTFLMIMHTAIAAKSASDPEGAAVKMSMAIGTSECIPEEMSAGQAASEYTYHLFNRDGDEVPPMWTGLMSRAEFEAKRGPNEMLIGEDWHIENPRWLGLPGESGVHGSGKEPRRGNDPSVGRKVARVVRCEKSLVRPLSSVANENSDVRIQVENCSNDAG